MTEEIVHEWELDSGILTKLTGSSCPLLAANSSFGPNHNPTMFMLKLYYNSLSLELDNFTTPFKIKSFTVKNLVRVLTLPIADMPLSLVQFDNYFQVRFSVKCSILNKCSIIKF